jgi:hypothetical protein
VVRGSSFVGRKRTEPLFVLSMLQAIPKRWLSWDFTVLQGSTRLADIDMSLWREKGALTVQGKTYQVYREGLVSGAFVLESPGRSWRGRRSRARFDAPFSSSTQGSSTRCARSHLTTDDELHHVLRDLVKQSITLGLTKLDGRFLDKEALRW